VHLAGVRVQGGVDAIEVLRGEQRPNARPPPVEKLLRHLRREPVVAVVPLPVGEWQEERHWWGSVRRSGAAELDHLAEHASDPCSMLGMPCPLVLAGGGVPDKFTEACLPELAGGCSSAREGPCSMDGLEFFPMLCFQAHCDGD